MLFNILLFFAAIGSVADKPTVIVSIPPQKGLLQKIAGESVEIALLVPPGASPHAFEPTPKELLSLSSGKVWFRIGEGFEEKAIKVFRNCEVVDMRDNLPLIHSQCSCCHHGKGGEDLHYWLSPRLLQLQASSMTSTLCKAFPENAEMYKKNLEKVQQELTQLDERIHQLLEDKKGHFLIVAHSAFGYFCQDYGLIQLSLEEEGREPTPKALVALVEKAKNEKAVFAVEPYSSKGISLIAKEIGADIFSLNPYAEDPMLNLEFIAQTLHDSL